MPYLVDARLWNARHGAPERRRRVANRARRDGARARASARDHWRRGAHNVRRHKANGSLMRDELPAREWWVGSDFSRLNVKYNVRKRANRSSSTFCTTCFSNVKQKSEAINHHHMGLAQRLRVFLSGVNIAKQNCRRPESWPASPRLQLLAASRVRVGLCCLPGE